MENNLSLVNWLMDGKYRSKVLRVLSDKPDIPTNIAKRLGVHKSSLSRVLGDLYNKKLIEKITSSSRTITYRLTSSGKTILQEFDACGTK